MSIHLSTPKNLRRFYHAYLTAKLFTYIHFNLRPIIQCYDEEETQQLNDASFLSFTYYIHVCIMVRTIHLFV